MSFTPAELSELAECERGAFVMRSAHGKRNQRFIGM